jgi:hypothetical protein
MNRMRIDEITKTLDPTLITDIVPLAIEFIEYMEVNDYNDAFAIFQDTMTIYMDRVALNKFLEVMI